MQSILGAMQGSRVRTNFVRLTRHDREASLGLHAVGHVRPFRPAVPGRELRYAAGLGRRTLRREPCYTWTTVREAELRRAATSGPSPWHP